MQEEMNVEIGVRYRQVFLFDSFPSDINGTKLEERHCLDCFGDEKT